MIGAYANYSLLIIHFDEKYIDKFLRKFKIWLLKITIFNDGSLKYSCHSLPQNRKYITSYSSLIWFPYSKMYVYARL